MPGPTDTPLSLRIARKEEIAIDTFLFELRHPAGSELPAFTPGAHVGVTAPSGALRKLSLCNAPEERDHYEVAVKREQTGRGGSVSLAEDTAAGDLLTVSAPRNNFPLKASAAGYIFIAGGIGITPIVSMIRHVSNTDRARFKLYYCTRTPEATAFGAELGAPELAGKVKIHHDQGEPQRAFDFWPILETPRGEQVYCCGPRSMMRDVQDMTGHWPSSAVHFEAFTEAPRSQPNDLPFRVRLARSGEVIDIPVGATILETLRAKGYELRSSCESGTCGTCRTKWLAGEPDHRDFVLHESERPTDIMICVSRARSDELVVDL